MTDAERQARCRDRKNAALAAVPGPFDNLMTMEDLAAALAGDPRLLAEVQMEYAESLAELGESEE